MGATIALVIGILAGFLSRLLPLSAKATVADAVACTRCSSYMAWVVTLASMLVVTSPGAAVFGDQKDRQSENSQKQIQRDLEILHVREPLRSSFINYLPKATSRVLGAALETSARQLSITLVMTDGAAATLKAEIPATLVEGLIKGGFCSDKKRCRNVCCPLCSNISIPGVSRDPRIKILEDKYGSVESLFKLIHEVEERIRGNELRIESLETELRDPQRRLRFPDWRALRDWAQSAQVEVGQLKRDIRVARKEKKHLGADLKVWRALLSGREPPDPDLERELNILGIGAGLIAQILQFVPHPAARALGIALGAGGTGLSIWLVMADGSDRRVTMPIDRTQSSSLIRSGICRDGNRCGGVRCPICGWNR